MKSTLYALLFDTLPMVGGGAGVRKTRMEGESLIVETDEGNYRVVVEKVDA